jgi:hypothetical protein
VAAGGLLFLSGQIPLDPHTQKLVTGEIEEQTVRVIENLAAGSPPRFARRSAHDGVPPISRSSRA